MRHVLAAEIGSVTVRAAVVDASGRVALTREFIGAVSAEEQIDAIKDSASRFGLPRHAPAVIASSAYVDYVNGCEILTGDQRRGLEVGRVAERLGRPCHLVAASDLLTLSHWHGSAALRSGPLLFARFGKDVQASVVEDGVLVRQASPVHDWSALDALAQAFRCRDVVLAETGSHVGDVPSRRLVGRPWWSSPVSVRAVALGPDAVLRSTVAWPPPAGVGSRSPASIEVTLPVSRD